jgi:hypothetical protein
LLPDTISFPYQTNNPFIVADKNYVFIIFNNAQQSPVRMRMSNDYGNTWSDIHDISDDLTGMITWASMNENTISILYPVAPMNRKILRSTDLGITWTRTDEDFDMYTRITLSPGTLHLIKHTAINNATEVEYRFSTNLGSTWQLNTVISSIDGYYSDLPTITSYTNKCGTELLTAWRDTKYGWYGFAGASIISRASIVNGERWQPEILLTSEPKGYNPSSSIKGNVRAVGWDHEVLSWDSIHTFVSATNNSLNHFSPMYDLTNNKWGGGGVMVAASSHTVHVVYETKVGSTFRIFYRRGEFIPTNASISLPSSSVEMETTEVDETTIKSIQIGNTGSDTLFIGTVLSNNENFTVTPPITSIPPFQDAEFTIRFTPKIYGEISGKIIFYHNGQSSPDCFDVEGSGKSITDTVRGYERGDWNLLSSSFNPEGKQSLPEMFAYDGSYVSSDSMEFGRGYWAKPSDSIVVYTGAPVWSCSIPVRNGWNMIGSLTDDVIISNITTQPEGLLSSQFFGFIDKRYTPVDTLKPGRGYWIKVNDNGNLILSASKR